MPYWIRSVLFVSVLLAITAGTAWYVQRRLSEHLGLSRPAGRALLVLLCTGPLLMLVARRAEALIGAPLAGALGIVGSLTVTSVLGATALLAVRDLVTWLRTRAAQPDATVAEEPVDNPSRRLLLQRLSAMTPIAAAGGVSTYGAFFGRHDFVLEEVPVRIPGLSAALDGYRIVQVSDLHFGVFSGGPERRAAVELARRARPDLIVVTGDLVDNSLAHAPEVGRLVRELDAIGPRDGVAVIGGNHDYYAGMDAVLEAARRGGGRVLRNEGFVVGGERGFTLVGLDDLWGSRFGWGPGPDLDAALADLPSDLPRIVLSHNPVTFEETAGRVALQLSGHTHGGQVALAGYPFAFTAPYVRGLYHEAGSTLYVNRGIGVAGPVARIGAPPEVTLIVLRT